MSLYEPPFLIPSEPSVQSGSLFIGRYGSPDQASPPDQTQGTLEAIEQYAPTVVKLISGLSPEESEAVLKERIAYLESQVNTPILGIYARTVLPEYRARLKVLQKHSEEDRLKRIITTAGYVIGLLGVGALTLYVGAKAVKAIKEV